ncbi:GxxExxY protein [bacterium E08(2017)]|nr:GxxExxY protein [bacterium E08(2017)]
MLLEEELTSKVIGAAIEVHKHWGPGLYEDIYERSLCHELDLMGIPHESQLSLPLHYKGVKVGEDFKCDVFVDGKVVVENKAVKELMPVHEAQLLTYMKLLNVRVGILINYNVDILKKGIRRMVL